VVPLTQTDYVEALRLVSHTGLTGGIVYDALHTAAAQKAGCSRIYTYNVEHFRHVCPPEITVASP
jgi:predicted nucleic acid-binding protein